MIEKERCLLYNTPGGGILSNMKVIAIVGISSCYSGIFKGTDFLHGIKDLVGRLNSKITPFGTTLLTSVVTAAVSCNQTLSIMLTNQLCGENNPDKKENYCRPAYWLEAEDLQTMKKNSRDVVVPTDFRTTASPTGTGDYVHYAQGGLSWAVPYVAGLYALGVQVYPQLTKKTFLKAVRATSAKQTCEFQGTSFSLSLVQPARLIDYLQALNAE